MTIEQAVREWDIDVPDSYEYHQPPFTVYVTLDYCYDVEPDYCGEFTSTPPWGDDYVIIDRFRASEARVQSEREYRYFVYGERLSDLVREQREVRNTGRILYLAHCKKETGQLDPKEVRRVMRENMSFQVPATRHEAWVRARKIAYAEWKRAENYGYTWLHVSVDAEVYLDDIGIAREIIICEYGGDDEYLRDTIVDTVRFALCQARENVEKVADRYPEATEQNYIYLVERWTERYGTDLLGATLSLDRALAVAKEAAEEDLESFREEFPDCYSYMEQLGQTFVVYKDNEETDYKVSVVPLLSDPEEVS